MTYAIIIVFPKFTFAQVHSLLRKWIIVSNSIDMCIGVKPVLGSGRNILARIAHAFHEEVFDDCSKSINMALAVTGCMDHSINHHTKLHGNDSKQIKGKGRPVLGRASISVVKDDSFATLD